MKRIGTLIVISLLLAAGNLFAQTDSQWLMKVHIPFNFAIGDQPMPTGIYNVYTMGTGRTIRITNVDGRHSTLVNTQLDYSKSTAAAAHLVFTQHGSESFLTQVWAGGEDMSRDVNPSKRALELATEGVTPQTATVLALWNRR